MNAGETWTLRCSGKFPLEWVFPTAEGVDADENMMERVNITDEVIPGDNPRPHVSYLVIRDLVSNLINSPLSRLVLKAGTFL
jgi:hypothetical protein